MRRAALVLISVLVILLIVGGLLSESLLVMQRIAAVSDSQGRVEVRSRGREAFLPLAGSRHVLAGDYLRTGPDGSVTLNWVDGTRVRIGPSTTMEVLKCQINRARNADTYLFKLDFGQVWIRVLKALSQQSKFEVRTPTATAAVRGTVFSVAVAGDGTTKVSVLKGQVDVATDGRNLAVRTEQIASIDPAHVGALEELGPRERAAWEKARSVAMPALEIHEPTSGSQPVTSTTVRVTGKAERYATLTVNGELVKQAPSGRFDTQIPVPAGADEFDIVVRLRDAKGFTNELTRTLRR